MNTLASNVEQFESAGFAVYGEPFYLWIPLNR